MRAQWLAWSTQEMQLPTPARCVPHETLMHLDVYTSISLVLQRAKMLKSQSDRQAQFLSHAGRVRGARCPQHQHAPVESARSVPVLSEPLMSWIFHLG